MNLFTPTIKEPDHPLEQRLMTLLCRVSGLDHGAVFKLVRRDLDWGYIFRTAHPLYAVPLIYFHLKEQIPDGIQGTPLREVFKREYHLSLANNLRLLHEFDRITALFSEHGIPSIALKGTQLIRELYPNPAIRPMFDIDLLVKREDLKGAHEILRNAGYRTVGGKPPRPDHGYYYDAPYRKESGSPVLLELHWDLGEKNRYRINVTPIWNRAVRSNQGPYLEMDDDDTFLYLALHFFKHYLFKRLIWICDLHEWTVRKAIHWERVVERARSQSIATFLLYTVILLEDFYQAPLPVEKDRIIRVGPIRKKILDGYLRRYPLFRSLNRESYIRQRLFAFSCIDRMPDRMRFTRDALRRDRRGK